MNVKTTPLRIPSYTLRRGWIAVGNYQRVVSENPEPFTSHAENRSHRRSYLAWVLLSLSFPFFLIYFGSSSPFILSLHLSPFRLTAFISFDIADSSRSHVRSRTSISKESFHPLSRRLRRQGAYGRFVLK